MGGIISPIGILFLIIVYLALFISSLLLILKNEDGFLKLLWVVVVFLFPFIGSIIYIASFFISKKKA